MAKTLKANDTWYKSPEITIEMLEDTYKQLKNSKLPSSTLNAVDFSCRELNRENKKMHYMNAITNSDKYFLLCTDGTLLTYDNEDDAVAIAKKKVAKNDTLEAVICKAVKTIRIDKPVLVEEVK